MRSSSLENDDRSYQLSYHVVPPKKQREDINDFLIQVLSLGGDQVNFFIELFIVTGNGAIPIRPIRLPQKRNPDLPLIHAVLSLDTPRSCGPGTNSVFSLRPSLHSSTSRLSNQLEQVEKINQSFIDRAETLGTFTMMDTIEGYSLPDTVVGNGDLCGTNTFDVKSIYSGKVISYHTDDSGVKVPFVKDKRGRFIVIITPNSSSPIPPPRVSSPTPLTPEDRTRVTFTTRTMTLTTNILPFDYDPSRKGSIPFSRNSLTLDSNPPPPGYQPENSTSEGNKTYLSSVTTAGDGIFARAWYQSVMERTKERDFENSTNSPSSMTNPTIPRPLTSTLTGSRQLLNKVSRNNLRESDRRPSTAPTDVRVRKNTDRSKLIPPSPCPSSDSILPEVSDKFNPNAYGWDDGWQYLQKTGKMPNVD